MYSLTHPSTVENFFHPRSATTSIRYFPTIFFIITFVDCPIYVRFLHSLSNVCSLYQIKAREFMTVTFILGSYSLVSYVNCNFSVKLNVAGHQGVSTEVLHSCVWHCSRVWPASRNAISDSVLVAGTASTDAATVGHSPASANTTLDVLRW